METAYNITSDILEQALLLNIHTGGWSGKSTQDENDVTAQGMDASKNEVFVRGSKWLVPKKSLDPFSKLKLQIQAYMSRVARKFYIRGTWMVPRSKREEVAAQMQAFETQWQQLSDTFIENLPALKAQILEKYLAEYPALAPYLEGQYPPDEDVRLKFKLDWTFGNWCVAQVEEAAAEMEQSFRDRASSYLGQLENEVYVSSVQACIQMAQAMDTKSGNINERKIERFKALVGRIGDDNRSFLNSERIQSFLSSVESNVFAVQNWQTDGSAAKQQVKEYLQGYIASAAETAEAAEVASTYIRRVAAAQDEEPETEPEVTLPASVVRRISLMDDTEDAEETSELEVAATAAS